MRIKYLFKPINAVLLFLIITTTFPASFFAQSKEASSSEIYLAVRKLNVLGSVLYIAAHPDDENNAILAYMSKEKLVRTGYMALTRGDGGQNLVGSEKGDLLGVIRTQELLSARRIDGAEQFFSRAVDFGFSKTPEETLKNWDRELVLSDIVKVIRQFKPDIIITRFSNTRGGHGHHLASAILAEEAFYAAADPSRFPEQLNELQPWQAKRIVWDSFFPSSKAITLDVGLYNSILGKSYNEIAGESRTMHKTQGFGVALGRGSQTVQFDHTAGDSARSDIFDDIDISWNRVENSGVVEKLIEKIQVEFDYEHPDRSVPALIELYNELSKVKSKYWSSLKKKEVKELIRLCSGLWLEAIVWQPGISPGDNIDIRTSLVNRSNVPMKIEKLHFTYSKSDTVVNKLLENNTPLSLKYNLAIPLGTPYSQPYWLKDKNNGKMFTVNDPDKIGMAENKPAVTADFYIKINDTVLEYDVPVIYRWTDAVEGEKYRPFLIGPKLSVKAEEQTYIFPDQNLREINVQLEAKDNNQIGKLYAVAPSGWKVEPEFMDFSLLDKGDIGIYSFNVTPSQSTGGGEMTFKAKVGKYEYNDEVIEIDYPHIKYQTVLVPAKVNLERLEVNIVKRNIGYIMGSGDDVPVALRQLGYNVDLLNDDDLDNKDLSQYDVIISGIRAFNVRENLDRQQKRLIEFMENGGTWIVQHNTRFGIQVPQIGPYPFPVAGRDRVAEEDAVVQILLPDHQIFNFPNKISEKDFDGWVQERGVNFADSWGGKLYPLLSCHDKGEPSKLGGLLYARYGKGIFIYTAYSWFRQLPAGVPGAYRLFVNLVSAKLNK